MGSSTAASRASTAAATLRHAGEVVSVLRGKNCGFVRLCAADAKAFGKRDVFFRLREMAEPEEGAAVTFTLQRDAATRAVSAHKLKRAGGGRGR